MTMEQKRLFSAGDIFSLKKSEVENIYKSYSLNEKVLPCSYPELITHEDNSIIYTEQGKEILDFSSTRKIYSYFNKLNRAKEAMEEFRDKKRFGLHEYFPSQVIAGLVYNLSQVLPKRLKAHSFHNTLKKGILQAIQFASQYHLGQRSFVLVSDQIVGVDDNTTTIKKGGLLGSNKDLTQLVEKFSFNDLENLKKKVKLLRTTESKSLVSCIIVETFSSTTYAESSVEFMLEVKRVCEKDKILLIFVEGISAWGTTKDLFHFLHYNILPNLLVLPCASTPSELAITSLLVDEKLKKIQTTQDLDKSFYVRPIDDFIIAIESMNSSIIGGLANSSQEKHEKLHSGLLNLQIRYPSLIETVAGKGLFNKFTLNCDFSSLLKKVLHLIPEEFKSDTNFFSQLFIDGFIFAMYAEHGILLHKFQKEVNSVGIILNYSTDFTAIEQLFIALDQVLSLGKKIVIAKYSQNKFFRFGYKTIGKALSISEK